MALAVGVPSIVLQRRCGGAAAMSAGENHVCAGGCVTSLGAGCGLVDTVRPPATGQS